MHAARSAPRSSRCARRTSPCTATGPAGDAIVLPGSIVERAFLGETWDYAFQSDASDLKLRIMSPPRHVFDVGQKVWLEINPSHIMPIQDDPHA